MINTFDKKWDKIYYNSKQLNLYPYSDLVSYYFKNFNKNKIIKVLEVGCGAANNLSLFTNNKNEVYGIDASPHAIKFARNLFKKRKKKINLSVCDFTKLPFKNNYFDLIINRAALCNTNIYNANIAMSECHRVLKKNGKFYSTFFSNYCTYTGTKIEKGFYKNFRTNFKNSGFIKFYNLSELKKLYKKNNIIIDELFLNNKINISNSSKNTISEWYVYAKK